MGKPPRLHLGMVGGGRGAFIGAIHAAAARIDDRFEVVAGCLSSDPEIARLSAVDWRITAERAYTSFTEMAEQEALRQDRIDAVAIVTPNHTHFAVSKAFLEAGFHVVCDKPLATNLDDCLALIDLVETHKAHFVLTHTYSGYPMVRMARELVRNGNLGKIHSVHVEFIQDWLAEPLDTAGDKQASWRTDPERAGPGGCVADIGSHALHLARYVSGLEVTEVCARLRSIVAHRRLDDYAHSLLQFANGAEGTLVATQVSQGNGCGLQIRVEGYEGTLSWHQERPNELRKSLKNGDTVTLNRRLDGADWGSRSSRLPRGLGEGFIEAFANIYSDTADLLQGRAFAAGDLPDVYDGAVGIAFVEAAVASSAAGGQWTALREIQRNPKSVPPNRTGLPAS